MNLDDPNLGKPYRMVSWAAFALLAITAAAFAWYVPRNRHAVSTVFLDFHLKLPAGTQFCLNIPAGLIVGVNAAVVAAALVVQIRARSHIGAGLLHVLLTAAIVVAFLAYREAMADAYTTLIEGISGHPGGR